MKRHAVVALLCALIFAAVCVDASASTIKGTIYRVTTSGKVATSGAGVYLYRWNGSSWVSLGKKATSGSAGGYEIKNLGGGYYYYVRGYKVYGSCFTGAAIYDGNSPSGYLASNHIMYRNATMQFIQWFYC